MATRDRRKVLGLATAILILGLLAWMAWTPSGTGSPVSAPSRPPELIEDATAPEEHFAESPPSTPAEDADPTLPRRLHFRDARNGNAMAGVRFRLHPPGEGAPTAEYAAERDGTFVLPKGDGWSLSFLEPSLHSLRPKEMFADSSGAEVREVWCYWTATVTGTVDVEDPSRLGAKPATVSARPVTPETVRGFRRPTPESIGTPEWVEKQMRGRKFSLWACTVENRQYRFEIPLIGSTAVAAWAPGHTVEILRVDPATAPGAVVQANFNLRAGVRARVRVLDESGVPVANASVQFLDYFVVPSGQIDHAAISLEGKVARLGMGIVENAEKGTSRASLNGAAGTGKDGRALAYVGSHGRQLLLMVSAKGKVPFIKRLDRPDEFDDAEIILKSNQPARQSYRLSSRGRFAGAGATLLLLEMIDTMTLDAGTVTANADGAFPADSIVAGRQYFVILNDPERLGRRSGTVTFGDDEVVDISSFE